MLVLSIGGDRCLDETFKHLAGRRLLAEDVIPDILRKALPSYVRVLSRVEENPQFPFVLVASTRVSEGQSPVSDQSDMLSFNIHAFCRGIDAEIDAANLTWACVNAIKDAASRGDSVGDGQVIVWSKVVMEPLRRSDWQDASGPVQYQDLPQFVERFEAWMRVRVIHRK